MRGVKQPLSFYTKRNTLWSETILILLQWEKWIPQCGLDHFFSISAGNVFGYEQIEKKNESLIVGDFVLVS